MHIRAWRPIAVILFSVACALWAASPGIAAGPIVSGWSMFKEGKAEGTAEIDAKHATNPNPHLIRIAITKLAPFGEGRLGVKNSTPIAVKQGQSYDITFKGISEGIGVGLVFSLETDDGKVLARTTLPEIGRGARGGRGANTPPTSDPGAESPAPWRDYLLSVKAVASAPNAHLTITAIEPGGVWIENVSIEERRPSN